MHRAGLTLATLALSALGGCSGGSAVASDPGALPAPSIPAGTWGVDGTTISVPLILEVSGDANADITYASGPGQPTTRISAGTPWTTTLQLTSSDAALAPTLTARTSSTSTNATITCRIKVAGALVEAKTARGPHALADCSTSTEPTQTP